MGTGLMQWTAAEMVECDAQSIAAALYFMFLVCAPTMEMDGVKFCDQDTGTNLHTQERKERFSTLQLLASSVWRHLSCSPFCHVLSGAKSIIYQSWYSCACTPFLQLCLAIQARTGPKNMDTSTLSTIHHHDE
jgi:hypothetical protein